MEKGNKTKGGKKSKQRMTVMFIVASDGYFIFEPTVLWRTNVTRLPLKTQLCYNPETSGTTLL